MQKREHISNRKKPLQVNGGRAGLVVPPCLLRRPFCVRNLFLAHSAHSNAFYDCNGANLEFLLLQKKTADCCFIMISINNATINAHVNCDMRNRRTLKFHSTRACVSINQIVYISILISFLIACRIQLSTRDENALLHRLLGV